MIEKKNVLVIGSGGREHALVRAFAQDEFVNKIFCTPGNGGTGIEAENVHLDVNNFDAVLEFVENKDIHFTVVGPETPLANGIVDAFNSAGKLIFGPTSAAARLESSKVFARDLLEKYHIPQPAYIPCNTKDEARIAKVKLELPVVLKADGLAAGKGVLICKTEPEFEAALVTLFDTRAFGSAGDVVSVEKCLMGEELSVFAVCDGNDFVILNSAQDHKRAYENDEGPNTGGMGAYSPTPLSTRQMLKLTGDRIIAPTLAAMREEGCPFSGFLYVGLMIVKDEPYVIEFNVRMGDPEAQVIIPLLDSSLYELLYNSVQGKLKQTKIKISPKTAVTVVLASAGYPGTYKKGVQIHGLEKLENDLVYHAGTAVSGNMSVTSGGRVLNVVGFGKDLPEAIADVYSIVGKIDFDGKYYRKDIGARGLKYLRNVR